MKRVLFWGLLSLDWLSPKTRLERADSFIWLSSCLVMNLKGSSCACIFDVGKLDSSGEICLQLSPLHSTLVANACRPFCRIVIWTSSKECLSQSAMLFIEPYAQECMRMRGNVDTKTLQFTSLEDRIWVLSLWCFSNCLSAVSIDAWLINSDVAAPSSLEPPWMHIPQMRPEEIFAQYLHNWRFYSTLPIYYCC